MTERIDRAQIAQNNLDWVAGRESTSGAAAVTVAAAQVHATLALVEQQRIANLIALANLAGNSALQESDYDEGATLASDALHALVEYERTPATPYSDPDDHPVIRPDIAAALGIEAPA